ncbi:MAG TPA: acetyl-CoA carboxylase biotin carboxyl carrier protein [Bacillota bacterium]|nr:acetyl-CoA carboxylase biotin carboxyl carrier protein [Bacillota bacterium]
MNIKELKELVKMLDGTDIVEFTYENDGTKVAIKKGYDNLTPVIHPAPLTPIPVPGMAAVAAQTSIVSAQTPSIIEEKNEGLGPNQVLIVAPMVGTFYRAPGPDVDPFVQAGQHVEAGQVVCIIEAMKLMNEIESEYKGKVVDVLVQNAQPVEYGQPLFVLEKN